MNCDLKKDWHLDQKSVKKPDEEINEIPASVPEHMAGELDLPTTTALGFLVRSLGRTAGLVLMAIITAPKWPFTGLGHGFGESSERPETLAGETLSPPDM